MSIFRPEDEARVRELLSGLDRRVELVVGLGPEETPIPGAREIDFSSETIRVVEGISTLSEHVSYRVEDSPRGVDRFPAVLVLPEGEDAGLRYYGLPWGYEIGSLIGAVVEAGRHTSSLAAESLARLDALEQDLAIDVFVTPT
jgi:alkyl hydroperoxide reductase subunit AhpF